MTLTSVALRRLRLPPSRDLMLSMVLLSLGVGCAGGAAAATEALVDEAWVDHRTDSTARSLPPAALVEFARKAGAQPPAQPPATPAVTAPIVIEKFVVVHAGYGDWFTFTPSISLRETTGTVGVWVTAINFHLDNIGPQGNVPPWSVHKRVDAGATAVMIDPDVYGDNELVISGQTDADQVSVVITYIDDQNRSGSLTGVTAVTR